jgi:hypothetical protein
VDFSPVNYDAQKKRQQILLDFFKNSTARMIFPGQAQKQYPVML